MLPGRVTAAIAVFLCAAHAAPAHELTETASSAPAWTSISTPIPRAALLAALDLDPGLARTLTLVEVVRRLHEDDTRRGTLRARLAAMLPLGPANAKGGKRQAPAASRAGAAPGGAGGEDDRVPLPLTEQFWESCITKPRNARGGLAEAILTDPAVGLMYVALASTDVPTRLFLAGECARVSAIARTRAAAFTVVARSFRVRDGRLEPPGGDAALPLWTRLGLPVNDPSEFLLRLVTTDAGRLAYFYDTIAQLDPARQRFALGLSEAPGPNVEVGAAVYRVCADTDPSWSLVDRPFARMTVDVAFVLQQVHLTADGRMAGPATEAFLAAAFADGDLDRGRNEAPGSLNGPTMNAATLVRLVMVPDWIRRRTRLITLLFAQRVFAGLQPTDAADALTALRGIAKVETLPFALERAGVRSPAVLAAAVRRAYEFGPAAGGIVVLGPERQRAEISAFQGALVLIERLVYARALDGSAAGELVQRLLDERTADPLGYSGHVAQWVEGHLLARIGRERPARESADDASTAVPTPQETAGDPREQLLLEAVAGTTPDPPIAFEWENARYRLDVASAERARLRAIRRRQGGPVLDDALEAVASARALRNAGDTDDLTAVRATLSRLASHLAARDAGDAAPAGALDPLSVVTAASRALESHRPPASLRIQQARRLADLGSTMLGDVLRSLVYAFAIGDAEGQAFLAGDVSRLHEFGLDEIEPGRRRMRAWELPVDVSAGGQPWHLTGSLLAVDLSMSRFVLRRALGEMPSRQPSLSGPDRRTLVATLALMNPAELTDDTRTVLVDALRRGREVLETALAGGERLTEAMSPAGITGWRAQLLPWAHAFEPDAVAVMVARSELVWLGAGTPLAPDVHAWGAPTQTTDGAWALRFPGPEAIDAVGGRQASGYLPGRFADLTLRIAELMADRRVPSPLTREVLRMALQRFLDEARPAYPDDWLALVRQAGAITRAQLDDYVYGLTVPGGPLVPSEGRGVQQ